MYDKVINTLIIGAYKAGSTSLKNYLGEHPRICTHPQLEFSHFMEKECSKKSIQAAISREFKQQNNELLLAKHVGLYRSELGLKNLRKHNPKCKILFIIRNPVDRAYSAWKMEVERAGFTQPFSDLLDIVKTSDHQSFFYRIAVEAGLYGKYCETVTTYFARHQIKIILFEDLKTDPQKVCNEVFEFLDLNTYQPKTNIIHNQSKKPKSSLLQQAIILLSNNRNPFKKLAKNLLPHKTFISIAHQLRALNQSSAVFPSLDDNTRSLLMPYFEKDIEKMEQLANLDLSSWKTKRLT